MRSSPNLVPAFVRAGLDVRKRLPSGLELSRQESARSGRFGTNVRVFHRVGIDVVEIGLQNIRLEVREKHSIVSGFEVRSMPCRTPEAFDDDEEIGIADALGDLEMETFGFATGGCQEGARGFDEIRPAFRTDAHTAEHVPHCPLQHR
jgi:hypothetical protein